VVTDVAGITQSERDDTKMRKEGGTKGKQGNGVSNAAATPSRALAMFALFAIPGKIAAVTDNVTGHTELRSLCYGCWRCCYVSGVFDSWLHFKT
jgi:hypothetical protein